MSSTISSQQQRSAMPPKRPGPIVENTVKRPCSQFPLNKTKASEPEQAAAVTANAEATNEIVEIHTLGGERSIHGNLS